MIWPWWHETSWSLIVGNREKQMLQVNIRTCTFCLKSLKDMKNISSLTTSYTVKQSFMYVLNKKPYMSIFIVAGRGRVTTFCLVTGLQTRGGCTATLWCTCDVLVNKLFMKAALVKLPASSIVLPSLSNSHLNLANMIKQSPECIRSCNMAQFTVICFYSQRTADKWHGIANVCTISGRLLLASRARLLWHPLQYHQSQSKTSLPMSHLPSHWYSKWGCMLG